MPDTLLKLGAMRARLPESFDDADRVYSYSGGVSWNVAESMQSLGARTQDFHDIDALVQALAIESKPGDHILIMSNGGFGGIHQRLLDRLRMQQPQ